MKDANHFDIMIVDDNPNNLKILSTILETEGYKVRTLINGSSAIRAAEVKVPDLILLDINMPEMSGYEVCEHMKKQDSLKQIPIIFISALSETFDKVKAFEVGGVDYITKPVQIEEALARVKTHLKLKKYRSEIELKNKELNDALYDLKNAQAHIIQSEKLASLGVLAAGIAHEINNPVAYIYTNSLGLKKNFDIFIEAQKKFESYIQKLNNGIVKEFNAFKEEKSYDDRMEEMDLLMDNILSGSKKTADIVKSLRLFVRLDDNDKKRIDITESIESCLLILQTRIKNAINIQRYYHKTPPILCYPARINQVFMNILINAIDAIEGNTNEGKQKLITISTQVVQQKEKDKVMIEVADTGSGIPDDIITKIFDPFFTTKPVGKGIGLGLSITNTIIIDHEGSITVDSSKEGSCFRIVLPIE